MGIRYLKVGQEVKLRKDLESGKSYGGVYFVNYMNLFKVKNLIVSEIDLENEIFFINENHWSYSVEMLDLYFMYKSYREVLKVKFVKLNPSVIIPSKNLEDAGYDLYANFEGESIVVQPNEVVMVPTGIKSAYPDTHMAMIKERGSTGYIAMSVKAGVMDSGFRNEWKVLLNNTNTKAILITKEENKDILDILKDDYIIYKYSKAIAQFLFLPVPLTEIEEVSLEDVEAVPSVRGNGMLGSTNKNKEVCK